jgi:hypothetical protein
VQLVLLITELVASLLQATVLVLEGDELLALRLDLLLRLRQLLVLLSKSLAVDFGRLDQRGRRALGLLLGVSELLTKPCRGPVELCLVRLELLIGCLRLVELSRDALQFVASGGCFAFGSVQALLSFGCLLLSLLVVRLGFVEVGGEGLGSRLELLSMLCRLVEVCSTFLRSAVGCRTCLGLRVKLGLDTL